MPQSGLIVWARRLLLILAVVGLAVGCVAPKPAAVVPSAWLTPQPTSGPSPISPAPTLEASPTSTPISVPQHRIGIRVEDGVGEFYDRLTGDRFVPRGFNYVHIAAMSSSDPNMWHSTLNPGFYDPLEADRALAHMQAAGYNTVRVFVDCCRTGNNVGSPAGGVAPAYMENLVDFLDRAAAHQIFVLLEVDGTPADGGYGELWRSCCEDFEDTNIRYLTRGGFSAKRRSLQDIVQGLIDGGARTDVVLSYGLTNEVFFTANTAPLSKNAGRVTTANGKTYDLSNPAEKQLMMDENLVLWVDEMRDAILDIDPTALVNPSFFEPQSPNPTRRGDPRVIRTFLVIWQSKADFIDLHAYPGASLTLKGYVENYEINGMSEKPILMGEFGAFKWRYPSAEQAAAALKSWQIESCRYGFDGWLLWTYDAQNQTELWNGMSGDGVIHAALSPASRPDPCLP